MREYELKRGHWKHVEGDQLLHLMQDIFGETKEEGSGYVVENWGAFDRLYAEYVDKTTIRVDTRTNKDASTEEAQRTIRAFNDFLELATGYDAKQRSKRAQKAAKEGKL